MYDELIKRLRTDAVLVVSLCDDLTDAADAIEELSAIREEQKAQIILMAAEIETLKTYAELYQSLTDKSLQTARNLLDAHPKWIPVTERLPDQNSENLYICLIVGGEYDQLSWYELCDFAEGQFWIRDQLYEGHVTHWMPLPEPPKEET